MTREAFHRDLLEVEASVIQMGAHVEHLLDGAVRAVKDADTVLAIRVARDVDIPSIRRMIGNRCLTIMACQAPVAGDLRELVAIQLVSAELERISDHALEIVQTVIHLRHRDDTTSDIAELTTLAIGMINQVNTGLQSLISGDASQARAVVQDTTELALRCEQQESVVRKFESPLTSDDSYAMHLLLLSALKRIARCANAIGQAALEMTSAERAAWN